MKKLLVIILSAFILFAGCASKPKAEKAPAESDQLYAILELGEYTLAKVKTFSDDDVVVKYLYEETSGLKVDCIDGKDYYEGTCLYGMPMTDIKALMGPEKFSVYWAICFSITQLSKGEDTRLIKYIFPNKDYFFIDINGTLLDDMVMESTHNDPNEMIELQIWLPISLVN
jgi:hypothetical protein